VRKSVAQKSKLPVTAPVYKWWYIMAKPKDPFFLLVIRQNQLVMKILVSSNRPTPLVLIRKLVYAYIIKGDRHHILNSIIRNGHFQIAIRREKR